MLKEGNKRKVKKLKGKEKETMNIKVSTDDRNILDNNLNQYKKNEEVEKTGGKARKIKNSISNTSTNLEKYEENINTLKEKIKSLEADILAEKQASTQECQILNGQMESQNNEIKEIASKNKKLISKLVGLKEELDDHLAVTNVYKIKKKEEKVREDKDILNEIKVRQKTKEVLIKQKKIEEKQINNLQQILEDNRNGQEEKLKDEKSETNEKINELQQEIIGLKHIKAKHQRCQKEITNLRSKLNVLSNELEFESKKIKMIETNNTMINEKREAYRTNAIRESTSENKLKILCNNIRIRGTSYKKMTNNTSNIGCSYARQLFKEIDKTRSENYIQTSGNIKSSDISDIDLINKKGLFTNEENEVLQKLIPNNYLMSVKEKYNNIEIQVDEIREKIKENEGMKTEIIRKKNDIDLSNIQLRKQERNITTLTLNLNKSKKETSSLNNKIKSFSKLVKTQTDLVNEKEKKNSELKEQIKKIKDKIKKGKLKEKKNIKIKEKLA